MPPSASLEKLINSLLASADSEAFREPVDWRGLGLHDYPTIIKRPMDLGTVKLRLERGAYPSAEACAADVRLIWENCRTYNAGGEPRKLHKAADNLSKRFEARFAKIPAGELPKPPSGVGGGGGGSGQGNGRGCGGRGGRGGAKGGGEAGPPPPTSEDRRRLVRQLEGARMEHVTAVVHEIDRRCPEALILRQAGQGPGGVGAEGVKVEDGDVSSGGSGDGVGGRDGGGGGGGVGDAAAMMSGTAAIEIEVDVDALDAWTFCAVERIVAPLAAQRRVASSMATPRKRPAKKKKSVTVAAASSSSCSSSVGGCKDGESGTSGGYRQHPHQHLQKGASVAEAAMAAGAVGRNNGKEGGEDASGGAGAEAWAGAGLEERERPCKKLKAVVGTGGLAVETKKAEDQVDEEVLPQPKHIADRKFKVDTS